MSGEKSHCGQNQCIDLTNEQMEEKEEDEEMMEEEEGEIISDQDKEEAEEQLKALALEEALKEAFEEEEEGLEWLNTQGTRGSGSDAVEGDISDTDSWHSWLDIIGELEPAEMEREQFMEEMDFGWYESEHHTQLLAAVKERDRQKRLAEVFLNGNVEYRREKEAMLKEKHEMVAEHEKEKQDIVKEKDEAVDKYRRLVKQLEERLECPMCLTVPKEAPAITCKEGHLACSSCLQGWLAGGRRECPYCRAELLVGAKSLLADLIIQNIDHECNLNGCKQRVPRDDLADHQKKCPFRLVKCPGSNQQCNMMVPFCQVVHEHVIECSDMTMCEYPDEILSFSFSGDCLEASLGWDTIVIGNPLGFFFVRTEKVNSLFTVEVVMEGTEEECEKVNVEIAIKDPNSKGKPSFSCRHHPRPMGKENNKEFCLSVTQAALAKTWCHNKDRNRIVFFVDIKITLA